MLRCCIALLVCTLANGESVATADQHTNWETTFDERFLNNPHERFRVVPIAVSGRLRGFRGRYDLDERSYSIDGSGSLVRRAAAGVHVTLDLKLTFDPLVEDGVDQRKTTFILVLANRSVAGFTIDRSAGDDAPATVTLIKGGVDQHQADDLRDFQIQANKLDGNWQLRYRHGLLTLKHGDRNSQASSGDSRVDEDGSEQLTLGSADVDAIGVQVIGVTWIQSGGKTTCGQMTLKSEPTGQIAPEQETALLLAADLNRQSFEAYNDDNLDKALDLMTKASNLFLRVHGDHHYDSGNSLINLATLLEEQGNPDKAGDYWARALAIHEKTLGKSHPQTSVTRFSVGKNLLQRDKIKAAEAALTRCRDDRISVLGPDDELVKTVNELLSKSASGSGPSDRP